MNEKRDDEGITEFTMRRIRNEIIEECAAVVDGQQETMSETARGTERHLTKRMNGNLTGLAFADGIRQLKRH